MRYLSFLFLLAFTSYAAVAQSDISATEQLLADVERLMQPDEFKRIQVGEEESVIFINEANTSLSKGVMILVSEAGRNAASHTSLAPIASHLNNYGWTTVLVTAPNFQWQIPSAPAQTTEPAQDQPSSDDAAPQLPVAVEQGVPAYDMSASLSQEMFDAQETYFRLLMASAQQEASAYAGFRIVVAQGTSAAFLTKIYAEGQSPAPDALVTIGVNWPINEMNNQIPDLLARVPVPVLDIYNQWDNKWSKSMASDRKIAAERALKVEFRQREIIGQALDANQFEYIAKEIYGWLTFVGW